MVATPTRQSRTNCRSGGEYEEYHPYGSTAWWAGNSSIEVSRKRYRYTGKERDEETGLYYHGARYYAPWLGRWASADPIGLGDGPNRFQYAHNSPVDCHDSTGLFTDQELGLKHDAQAAADAERDAAMPKDNPLLQERLDAVRAEASSLPRLADDPSEAEWTTADVGRYFLETEIIGYGPDDAPGREAFREEWFKHYGSAVATTASKLGVPMESLLGIAYIEVGGDPMWIDPAAYGVYDATGVKDPDKVSFGYMSMQVRVAAEVLGFDAKSLSSGDKQRIIGALSDPMTNIVLAGMHVAQLQQRHEELAGASPEARAEALAAWFNAPWIPLAKVPEKTNYGSRAMAGAQKALDWMTPRTGP